MFWLFKSNALIDMKGTYFLLPMSLTNSIGKELVTTRLTYVQITTPFSGRIQKYPKGFQTFPNDIQICHVNFRYFQMIIRNIQRDFRPFQMIFRFVM